MGLTYLAHGVLAALLALPPQGVPEERLYGRVETVHGEVHVGYVRWGRSGGAWPDLLGGYKELSEADLRQAARLKAEADPEADRAARSVVYNGIRITWDVDDTEITADTAQSGVRFGHVRRVERKDERSARVALKSGLVVELSSSGARTPFVDTISVETAEGLQVGLGWGDVAAVDFGSPPPGAAPRAARLHGTVRVRDGGSHTGFLTFDAGRIYTTDVMTGREGDRERSVRLGDVQTLEWPSGGSVARVTLANGESFELRDPRSGNRSLRVLEPALGGVQLPISRVLEIRFHPPERPIGYAAFEGGRRIRGTVTTRDGARYHGLIRWDNDESHTWEILNGSDRGVSYTVELGNVKTIVTDTPRRVRVTLLDGRDLELAGSNDVGPGNKGLIVEAEDGTFAYVHWTRLERVELDER
jgi:hypothetical protein